MKDVSLELFANRLRRLRKQHNLSTRELAELVGTSNATISRYEKGNRDPDLLLAHRIASYFGVTLEYMCGDNISSKVKNKAPAIRQGHIGG